MCPQADEACHDAYRRSVRPLRQGAVKSAAPGCNPNPTTSQLGERRQVA